MTYIKPLDGLRAIAVLFVIVSHWFYNVEFFQRVPFGEIGVDVFFVLSGFLITMILLQNRSELGKAGSRLRVIRQFVIRRTLRIFPIYYLTIIFLFICGSKTGTDIRHDFIYYLTYTSNILFFIRSSWDGMVSHLWSLAVEEQFYLIWPWLMIFLNMRWLFPVILLTILVGVISGSFIPGFGLVLTSSCLDAFGIGAFLAYDEVYGKEIVKRYIKYFAAFAALLVAITVIQYDERVIPLRTTVSVLVLCIIYYIRKTDSIGHILLSTKPLVFLGKISYGIYLYHNIIPWLWESILNKLVGRGILEVTFSRPVLLVQEFVILVVFSWLSWIVVEKRINGFKKYYPYAAKKKSPVGDPILAGTM